MAYTGTGLPRGLPGCLKKRRLLHEKEISAENCRQLGEKFFALGWWEDALEFFRKGNVAEGLAKLKDQALATGDAHLLARLGETDPAVWRRLAETALAQEKWRFALKALKQAGDDEGAAALAAQFAKPPLPTQE